MDYWFYEKKEYYTAHGSLPESVGYVKKIMVDDTYHRAISEDMTRKTREALKKNKIGKNDKIYMDFSHFTRGKQMIAIALMQEQRQRGFTLYFYHGCHEFNLPKEDWQIVVPA